MRAWGQAFRIPTAGRGRAQASIGMSCQPIAGYEREMFSAGCTMNIGSKKLLREVASTFCGAQQLDLLLEPATSKEDRTRICRGFLPVMSRIQLREGGIKVMSME